jgi:putative Holliday junction resolvase
MKKNTNESLLAYELGMDYGESNIGVALGNNGLVTPLKIISNKNQDTALYEIGKIVVDNKVGKIVLGLPLSPDGKETKQSLKIRKFAKILKTATKRPVVFQNERDTSLDALEEAISLDISKKKRRTNDHLAAALILKRYYNELKEKK